MNSTTTTRTRKPLREIHGVCKRIRQPADKIGSHPKLGLLEINGKPYSLLIEDTAYELLTEDGKRYHLPRDLSSCDCPDGTYRCERPGGCKHRKSLAALLRAAGL